MLNLPSLTGSIVCFLFVFKCVCFKNIYNYEIKLFSFH